MKYVLLFFFAINSYASLEVGECLADPASKRYLSNDFSTSYPKTTRFSCIYKCMSENGLVDIKGISSIKTYNISDDAKRIVCQGVRVKRVSWGYDFDNVEKFFSHATKIREVKTYANKNFDTFSPASRHLVKRLKSNLSEVSLSYAMAGQNSSEFAQASEMLNELSTSLESDFGLLKEYLNMIEDMNGEIGYELSALNLVLNYLKAEAYWLYQATSKTPAIKRFTIADEQGLEHDIENQRNWNELVMNVQEIV